MPSIKTHCYTIAIFLFGSASLVAPLNAEKPPGHVTASPKKSSPSVPKTSSVPKSSSRPTNQFLAAHSDFFHLLYPDDTQIKFHYRFQPENKESDGPGKFDLNEFSFAAEAPFPIARNIYYRFGLEYGFRLYDFDSTAQAMTNTNSEVFHRAVISAGAGLFLNDNLLLTGVAQPGIYTDFDRGLKKDDVRLFWNGLLVYRLNPEAQLLGGAAYNEVFDDTPLFPIIGIRLQGEDGRLQIAAAAPLELRVAFNSSPRTQFYAGYWISGDEYHIDLGELKFNAEVQDRHLGGGVIYWFAQHWNVNVEGGAALGSRLKFKVTDAGQFNGDLDPTGYLAAGVGVGL